MIRALVWITLVAPFAFPLAAQETIFNVPAATFSTRAKSMANLISLIHGTRAPGTYTPRVVAGIGHRIEIGINVNGIASPGPSQTTPTPTIKWKAYDGGKNGWVFILGDDVFIPAQNRTYNAGTYIYGEFAKTLKSQTRLTFGAFDFTSNVVATGNKAGGQFGIEQPVGKRLTIAADWFTGHHGAGYFTPGVAIKVTPKTTAYAAYEIGNSGFSNGNRFLLLEIGRNF